MKKIFYLILLGLVGWNLWLITLANIDLIAGRHVLFMDEWVTLDGVRQLFNTKSLSDFFFNVLDGQDHRYGRIHWNIISLFSAWPYFQWGVQGLIIAERMVPALLQIIAFLILVFSFVKLPVLRLLTFSCLIVFPNSSYYSHMPKPEPLQLLLISLFLRELLVKKNTHVLPWFFLGLAFGAKISTLPYFLFIFGITYFTSVSKLLWLKSLAYAVVGIVCAVPILGIGNFELYFHWLGISIKHSHDIEGIDFFSWYNYALNYSLVQKIIFNVIFLFILVLNVIEFKKNKFHIKDLFYNEKAQLFICSMSFLLPVMLNTKRLWFMYFHLGTVFMLIWMVASGEAWIERNQKRKMTYRTVVAVLLGYLTLVLAPENNNRYAQLATRTSSQKYQVKIKEYDMITDFLKRKSVEQKRRLQVVYGVDLFNPDSNSSYRITPNWRDENFWEFGADYIVEYNEVLPGSSLKLLNPKRAEYKLLEGRLEQELEYTSRCTKKICYKKVEFPLEQIVIFQKYQI